jgi:hypothetical protein
MEVRKKKPRGFKKEAQGVQVSPLNPLSVAPWSEPFELEKPIVKTLGLLLIVVVLAVVVLLTPTPSIALVCVSLLGLPLLSLFSSLHVIPQFHPRQALASVERAAGVTCRRSSHSISDGRQAAAR